MIFRVQQNTLTAYGIIWDGDGMEFVSLLTQMEGQNTAITVKLHTYGGSVFDGNLIYNALRNSKVTIDIHIMGVAASMGAVISLSRTSNVYMVENGYLMIHAASGTTRGTAIEHQQTAKLLKSIEANFIKKLVKRTGKTAAYVKKWLVGDNWFSAEEALNEGLITGIIDPETDTENINPEQLGITETYNRFAALLLPKNSNTNLETDMKKPIIAALNLQGVTEQSSDTAVIEAIKQHYEAKESVLQGELDAEKTKRETAENKLKTESEAAVTAELAQAKKEGKITADEEATYKGIAEKSGIKALKTVLKAIKPRKAIIPTITGEAGEEGALGREAWNWDKWQKEDPKGLEALAKDTPAVFQALYDNKYKK